MSTRTWADTQRFLLESLEPRLNLAPMIVGGDHVLLPDVAGQQISIMASGSSGDDFQGADLYLSIGGGTSGPVVTAIDMVGTGTLFNGNNLGQVVYTDPASDLPSRTPATSVASASGTVGPNGVLAILTVDTTGVLPGLYTITFTHPFYGDSDLPPYGPGVAELVSGTIRVDNYSTPVVQSFVRTTPAGSPTNATSLTYTLTFTESVSGVDPTDFVVSPTAGLTYSSVSVNGNGATYSVTINNVSGNGTIGLELINDGSIIDADTNPLTAGFAAEPYTIDQIAPFVQSINRTTPIGPGAGGGTVIYTVTFSEDVLGVDATDFAVALTGTVAAGTPIVSGSGSVYTVTINSVTGTGTLGLNLIDDGSIQDPASNLVVSGFTGQVYTVAPISVVSRYIFYNQSTWDGNNAAINGLNDYAAIATDKVPYIPNGQTAVFENVTSYSRGINGIMVDLFAGMDHLGISASDFIFKVGNNNSPESWASAPAPSALSVLPGSGVGGSDRIEITWANGAIRNQWLQVTVLATANTGLPQNDVFYWGNKIADSGTSPSAGTFNTTTTDAIQVYATLGSGKLITDPRDYNRDGQVSTTDSLIVYSSLGTLNRLNLAVPSAPVASPTTASNDGLSAIASALTLSAQPAQPPQQPLSQLVPSSAVTQIGRHVATEATFRSMAMGGPQLRGLTDDRLATDSSFETDMLDDALLSVLATNLRLG